MTKRSRDKIVFSGVRFEFFLRGTPDGGFNVLYFQDEPGDRFYQIRIYQGDKLVREIPNRAEQPQRGSARRHLEKLFTDTNKPITMKCSICNRPLKREPWITLGIGPICSKKQQAEAIRQGDKDLVVPYDGGDIWVRRSAPTSGENSLLTNVQRSIYRHSPTGFEFGYGGSGPSDLALNICRMFTDASTADKIYQTFKWEFLQVDSPELVIPRANIEQFIKKHSAPRAEQLGLELHGALILDDPLLTEPIAGTEAASKYFDETLKKRREEYVPMYTQRDPVTGEIIGPVGQMDRGPFK